jgi:uroporphyrinogen-III synthase
MDYTHALATRPEPQQSELVRGLADLGLEVVSLPAFEFEAVEPPGDLVDLGRNALVIFTSPRAVAFGLQALGGALPAGARAAAIGPATSADLASKGIQALQAPGRHHDSEALLAALDVEGAAGRALILAAPGGRKALERGLSRRGWDVTLAPVYRRVLLPPDPVEVGRLRDAGGVLSLWTSGVAMAGLLEGLEATERRAHRAVLDGTAIVASERLAARAEDHGFAAVVSAGSAANDALLVAAGRCAQVGLR